jgi:hypothetical protein
MPEFNCLAHPHVRRELVNATTGERTCPACAAGAAQLTAPPLPVQVAAGVKAVVEKILTCAHTGARLPYRPEHGMEICADCGCTVAVGSA